MQKFLGKFDGILSDIKGKKITEISPDSTTELKRQMRMNKVLMKIFVDIKLGLAQLEGYPADLKRNLETAKFAVKLHKSIHKYEDSDFSIALGMFPNKLRCENFNQRLEFFGERKIVTLFKEDIIKECRDTQQSVQSY